MMSHLVDHRAVDAAREICGRRGVDLESDEYIVAAEFLILVGELELLESNAWWRKVARADWVRWWSRK